jgi:3',5'-cyclic AMP phosphodiesterase CpdA
MVLGVLATVLAMGLALGQTPPGQSATGAQATATGATRPVSQTTNAFAPFVFIHAGDTELGSPDLPGTVKRYNLLPARAAAAGTELVVIAGDLIHDNDAEHWQAFTDGLKLFKMPVHVVPGNHDDPATFRKLFGPPNRVFTHNNCDFVCLDSNLLSPSVVSWLEDSLKASRAAGRTHIFVLMHHPPEGNADLDRLFRKYGVEAVLCGHLHKTGKSVHDGYVIYWVSGTAKARDANGLRYNVFCVTAKGIEQESMLVEPVTTTTATATAPAAK